MMDEFGQGAVNDARDRAAVLQPRLDMGQISIEARPQGERWGTKRKVGREPEPHDLFGTYAVGTLPACHPRIREVDAERDVEAGDPGAVGRKLRDRRHRGMVPDEVYDPRERISGQRGHQS
jgi:hypothetical protein